MEKFKLSDVDALCSDLSTEQQVSWKDIANTCFSSLRDQGIEEHLCEEKAILKANSHFSETEAVPAMALMFSDKEVGLKFSKKEGEEETTQLDMVGYSGGIIKDHWWWDDLVIDLDGVSFSADKFPILENHNTDKKIAFTGKPIVDENGITANPDTTVFLENDCADEFIINSKKGFPYQCSIYIPPTVIERIDKDAEVEVNGFTLKGPATVFRKSEFKEMSVCVFGWDSNTSATAFNKEVHIPMSGKSGRKFSEQVSDGNHSSFSDINDNLTEGSIMDKVQLKKDHPELYAEVYGDGETAGKDAATAAFGKEKADMDVKFEEMGTSIARFERAETIRSERELRNEAAALFASKLSKSDVPEHLHEKVKKHISYTKFMSDGKLDVSKFTEAIDTEISSWIDLGVSTSVMGSSFSSDESEITDKKEKLEKEIDDSVDTLLSVVQSG